MTKIFISAQARETTRAMLDQDYEKLRRRPYILTDEMDRWPLTSTWNQTWRRRFSELFTDAVADFYPFNMLDSGRHSPYLTRLPKAIHELEVDDGDLPADRHASLRNDAWFKACMRNDVAAEWHLKTHWKIVLIGSRGAGMFNHSDSLLTSSWHAHITGTKWWYVCGYRANGSSVCFEDILKPGDILYYPPAWHHETQCLETPTMTLTDTVAHDGNAQGILRKTYGECTGRAPLNFDFSSELCVQLDECATFWQSRDKTGWKNEKRPNWRSEAIDGEVAKKEKMTPAENNYDGRNYITE